MAQKNPRSHAALVLIVDDDEAVVQITAEILETLGTMFSLREMGLKLSNYYARIPVYLFCFSRRLRLVNPEPRLAAVWRRNWPQG